MAGDVALAFISHNGRDWIVHHGLFSNRVMNLWAVAPIAFLLLANYLPQLREALRFASVALGDLIFSAALALLLVAPAELRKAFAA